MSTESTHVTIDVRVSHWGEPPRTEIERAILRMAVSRAQRLIIQDMQDLQGFEPMVDAEFRLS